MTAMLNTNLDNQAKVASAAGECQRLGVKVLPPNINSSGDGFCIEGSSIRFGLAAVKNVGVSAVEPIVEAREKGGPFTSIEDFCRRVDLRRVNKRALECLVKAGALDGLGNRLGLLQGLDRIMALSQQHQRLQERGQASMFDLWGQSVPVPLPSMEVEAVEAAPREKLAWEKELLGVIFSDSGLGQMARETRHMVDAMCGQIDGDMVGQRVAVAGMVSSVRTMNTRDKRPFVICMLDDVSGSIEVSVWPDVHGRTQELWQEGNRVVVWAKVRQRGEDIGLSCERAEAYLPAAVAETAPSRPQRLVVRLTATGEDEKDRAFFHQIVRVLREHPGEVRVRLAIANGEGEAMLVDMPPDLGVEYGPSLHQELAALLGESALGLEP